MKKFLLTIIALLTISSQTILSMHPDLTRFFTEPRPLEMAQNDFAVMMTYDWDDSPSGQQYVVNRSWPHWTTDQKKQILLRLSKQGLLSAADLNFHYNSLDSIPQARFVQIGG